MEKEKSNKEQHEGHFYKGLFFGALIGVGLIWFLQSESGKAVVKRARSRLDEALSFEPAVEDFDEEVIEDHDENNGVKQKSNKSPRRFFKKNSK